MCVSVRARARNTPSTRGRLGGRERVGGKKGAGGESARKGASERGSESGRVGERRSKWVSESVRVRQSASADER